MYVENLLFFCSSISILFCIVILFCLLQVSYLTFAFWHFLIELFEFSLWLHCFRYKTFSSIIPMHELNDWFVSNFHQHCSFPWHCHKIFLCTWIFIVAYFFSGVYFDLFFSVFFINCLFWRSVWLYSFRFFKLQLLFFNQLYLLLGFFVILKF